jgi:hypothetical protein
MSDIDTILYPTVLPSLREDIPPVKIIVWKGADEYDTVQFDKVYPFDTIDDVKRLLCAYYESDSSFIPRFTFVGVKNGADAYSDAPPTLETTYVPIDYLWYPSGTNDVRSVYILNNPRKALTEPDMRFVTADGSYASPNLEPRGRSSLEDVFLKPRDNQLPTFHAFTLSALLDEYRGVKPVSEADWNKRFAPYFPNVSVAGPYEPDADDRAFAEKIKFFVTQRESTLDALNNLLEEGVELPTTKLTGIRQLRLIWKKPVSGFEGAGSLFYNLLASERRPFIRLLPSEGSGITKLHVKGVLPIPSMDDPKVLELWGRETSPTPGIDYLVVKYIHRPSIGITQPIYGTIQVLNDGTMNLLLQPPKQIKKLDPVLDFRNFTRILEDIFSGLPQPFDAFKLKEIAALFTLKTTVQSKKFNKARILHRLPLFQTFFQQIKPLPGETPIISLRYKAVSQYASEDKTFAFLTQLSTKKQLDGEGLIPELISALQDEFTLSKKEAVDLVAKWHEQSATYTVQIPEEGEFIESFNPGIDVHIYAQHPSYYFHINRIDSYETYIRLYTLLSLLFVEEDEYFGSTNIAAAAEMEEVTNDIEEASLAQEEEGEINTRTATATASATATAATASTKNDIVPTGTANSIPDWMVDDPFANASNAVNEGEVIAETAPTAIEASTIADTLAPAPAKGKKRPPIIVEDEEIAVAAPAPKRVSNDEQKLVNPKSWFIKKLQEADPRLFTFRTEDSDDSGYSRKCAGHDDRQPSVLTKDQYDRMREIYSEDPIFWIVYPLEGDDNPIQPLGIEETVTVMRYGADPENINYYFCPQYFCLSDEIMVREVDFESATDRDGKPKPPNTCPFCYGKLITDKKKAVPGYTVYKRKDKRGSTYHDAIDFMSKTTHPENFALPCCFLKQTTLRISNPQYAHLRAYMQREVIENTGANEESKSENEEEEEELLYKGDEAIEYAVLFETLYKSYILEPNKHPGPGIFATAPAKFDKFFRQNSDESIVTRVKISLKLRPNALGFLRVGTENTLYESLLGVIAPLLYKNSINEVRERILEVLTPRIFLNSHFGNLVLEFYNPADGSAMPPTKQSLMSWSQTELGVPVTSTNMYQLLRIYNSFKRFIRFIRDPTQRKDLRHIQPLLAEPGLFTTRGIQLVVMEDNGGEEDITIRCPTFGVSVDRNKKNDFVFISRSMKNIGATENQYARYELFIHTSNKAARGGEGEVHETIIKWDYNSRRYWPEIVERRVDEYMTQCQSRYRSLYTSQDGVNPMAMIPLSKAVDAAPVRPEGIVKDSYNHIVALTFRSKAGSTNLVALPIVDDGVISISSAFSIKNIYLDWDDFKAAPADEIVNYYKEKLEPLFSLYPGYIVKYAVKRKVDKRIVAVQLANGIYIPAAAPKDESILATLGIGIVEKEDDFQSEIDKRIAGIKPIVVGDNWDEVIESTKKEKSCGFDTELLRKSTYLQFEELYQQFRLMVSNWLTSHRAGSETRKGIEDIIFNDDLPEYEKRKRMYIFIGSTLLSWFYPDDEKWESQASFLRKDCRVINSPDACTGNCYWKASEGEEGGKCLLHVDAKTQLGDKPGERDVSTPELFTKRVIDELVRFPIRRRQLMKKGEISKISTIISPVRQGDQYIIPESSPTWTNLLRLDWARQIPEEPKYYEEMSRNATPEDEVPPEGELPAELAALLGEDTPLRLRVPDVPDITQPLMPFTGILGITLEQMGLADDATTLRPENLRKFIIATSKPVGLIDFRTATGGAGSVGPNIIFMRPMTGTFDSVTIFVLLPTEVGLLIQEDGDSTVKIAALPEAIQRKWEEADVVIQSKKRIAPPPEEEVKVPLLIGKKPITLKKRPIIANVKAAPLVEAPTRKTVRRRPVPVNNAPTATAAPITATKPRRKPTPVNDAPTTAPVATTKPRRKPTPVNEAPTATATTTAPRIRKKPVVVEEYPSGGVPETKNDI